MSRSSESSNLPFKGVIYGDYYLLGKLNRGGMAEVFLARSRISDDQSLLALKRTLPHLSLKDEYLAMFGDEGRIGRLLSHPNVCPVRDVGEYRGQRFLVMDFVFGKDLRILLRRLRRKGAKLPVDIAVGIILAIADALDYVHHVRGDDGEALEIVHRDISPQNILISYEGVPVLTDFGIAKSKKRTVSTQTGVLKGKISYMSPEQAKGDELDARSDLFSLSSVLYELLTSEHPFRGERDLSTIQNIAYGIRSALAEHRQDLSPELISVVDRGLRIHSDERISSAREFRTSLSDATGIRALDPKRLKNYLAGLFAEEIARESLRVEEYLELDIPLVETDRRDLRERFGDDSAVTDISGLAPSVDLNSAEPDDVGSSPVVEFTDAERSFPWEEKTRENIRVVGPSPILLSDEATAMLGSAKEGMVTEVKATKPLVDAHQLITVRGASGSSRPSSRGSSESGVEPPTSARSKTDLVLRDERPESFRFRRDRSTREPLRRRLSTTEVWILAGIAALGGLGLLILYWFKTSSGIFS